MNTNFSLLFTLSGIILIFTAITLITNVVADNDEPTYCSCFPLIFCPNYGEGSIGPRVDNLTKAECPEGHKYCCVAGPPVPPTTKPPPPQIPRCGIHNRSGNVPGFQREPKDLVNFGEFPWLVRILGPQGNFLGSGALISEYTIVTVAHIFDIRNRNKCPESIILGEWNDAVDVRPYRPVEISAKSLILHKDFNPDNLRNDIALIHLSSPVDLAQRQPNIGTVCLPQATFDDHRCLLSTYGNDQVPIVRKIDLPIIPSSKCEAKFKKTILGPGFILDPISFLCAGGESDKDACKGHGGAPLVCRVGQGHFQLTGVVSWGLTDDFCNGKGEHPGVYVNVFSYVGWIKDNMKYKQGFWNFQ